jgi:hypothetical protein
MLVTFLAPNLMPIDPALNLTEEQRNAVRERYDKLRFRVRNERAANCRVTIMGTDPGTFNREQLAEGIPLIEPIKTLGKADSDKLLSIVHALRTMLTDAWLTEVGHKRPGMTQGLPMIQADAAERKQESEIKALAAPIRLEIEVRPIAQ